MLLNISIDPLTGIENIFGLLQGDAYDLLGDCGTVLYMDLKKISQVNRNYGHDMGDLYLKKMVELIEEQLSSDVLHRLCNNVRKYRFGDKFILIFKDTPNLELYKHANWINSELNRRMIELCTEDTGAYFGIWSYFEQFKSASAFLKDCQFRMEKFYTGEDPNPDIPGWADYMIERLFDRIGDAIRAAQKAYTVALVDDVSQLANHRAGILRLNYIYDEHKKYGMPFSILFIDGDNLKRYNELSYEHGNEMIKRLGELITEGVRKDDLVCRWLSGDEFLVLLRETDKPLAYKLAERLKESVEKQSKLLAHPVTISIGVASFPEDGDSTNTILRVAENANAQAKRLGKNRVV